MFVTSTRIFGDELSLLSFNPLSSGAMFVTPSQRKVLAGEPEVSIPYQRVRPMNGLVTFQRNQCADHPTLDGRKRNQ